jgi:glutamine amidotransferase
MIAIVDYEMGNLGSVAKALKWLGADAVISSDPAIIDQASAVILPGVGAMEYAIERLESLKLDLAIKRAVSSGRPFLGICLGMQLMFQTSEEGNARGLGILPGRVRRFEQLPGLKIPHMGWNRLDEANDVHLETGEYYYFVHSFYCEPEQAEITAAVSRHGCQFTAAVRQNNVLLTQFHPEKSGDSGLRLLSSWLSKEVNL